MVTPIDMPTLTPPDEPLTPEQVAEILAEDGQGVEYGQPIMVIR